MATDVEKLVVQLSADIKGYQREMLKAQGVTNTQARAIENRYRQMNKNLDAIGKRSATALIAPLAGISAALSIREVSRYSDAWTGAKNSLAVAGVVGRNQVDVLDQLYNSAQANATPVSALADLFGKASQASDNLGASQSDLIKFSDGVATALRVSGASAAQSSGALTQLGQLLGSARVQAEEFNSVNEGARPILMAVAKGLDEAGGSVNKLKQLVNDGKVSGKQFFEAFLKGLPAVQAMASNATQTIEQGFVKVDNALTKYIGQTDSSLGASQRLVQGLNTLADNFDTVADATLQVASVIAAALVGRSIVGMIAKLGLGVKALGNFVAALKAAKSAAQLGTAIGGIGVAAGPIGAVIGVVAAGAISHFGSQAMEATARTEALRDEMRQMGILSDDLSRKVDGAAKSLKDLAPEELRQKLRDINSEMDRMNERSWANLFGLGAEDTLADVKTTLNALKRGRVSDGQRRAAKDIEEVITKAEKGELSLKEVEDRLNEIGSVNVSAGIDNLLTALRKVLPYMDSLKKYARAAAAEVDIPAMMSTGPDSRGALGKQRETSRKTEQFYKDRTAEAAKNDLERQIDTRTAAIVKAAGEVGVAISEAAARIQANKEIAIESTTKGYESSVSGYVDRTVGAESGGNVNAKNPNSTATGLGQFIESTWLKLFKKHFPTEAAGMTDSAILALRTNGEKSKALIEAYGRENAALLQSAGVSINSAADEYKLQLAHFLGPQGAINVLKAAPGTLASSVLSPGAVKANPTILGGGRTVDDVIAYGQKRAGQTTSGTQRIDARDNFAQTLAEQKAYIDGLKEETGLRQSLNPLVNDYGQAMSTLQAAQFLLTKAQQDGTDAGKELKNVQQLLRGDLSGLSPVALEQALAMRALAQETGKVDAASERLSASQGKLKETMEDSRALSKDMLGGFIRDMRSGKSATESLVDALGKVADKLLDMTLDNLFSGSNGGFLGSLLNVFGGGAQYKFASSGGVGMFDGGGYTGPGGKKEPAGVVHKGEVVWSQSDVRKAGGPAVVDAMRKGFRGYDTGGTVGMSAPRMPNLSQMMTAKQASGVTLSPVYQIDARGADQAAIARLELALAKRDRDLKANVRDAIVDLRGRRQI